MIGPAEAQMIGRYFGNNSIYNAAATATRVTVHLTSELEAAAHTGVHTSHGQHSTSTQMHTMHSHGAKPATVRTGLTEDELMQVLFSKADNKPFKGPTKQ